MRMESFFMSGPPRGFNSRFYTSVNEPVNEPEPGFVPLVRKNSLSQNVRLSIVDFSQPLALVAQYLPRDVIP
jgi:hypothetical protein